MFNISHTLKRTASPLRFRRWARSSWAAFASLHKVVSIGVLSVGMSIIALDAKSISAMDHDTTSICSQLDSSVVIREKSSPTRSVMTNTAIFNRSNTNAAATCQTLESALRVSPATDIRERGGKAVQADISIRGGSADQTQVMLNGINFTDVRTGHQTHSLPVDLDCIGGIELLDGVLGVGAYAGALNFKTVPLYPSYLRFHVSGGQYGYGYANFSGAAELGRTKLLAAASHRRSDGYINNTDFSNWNAYSRMSVDVGRGGSLDIQAGFQARDFGANGFYSLRFPDQFESTRTALASARYLLQSRTGWEFSAALHARGCSDHFELIRSDESSVPFNYHLTLDWGAEAWLGRNWALGRTTVGFDWTRNGVLSTVLGERLEEARHIGGSSISYTREAERSASNVWLRHSYQRQYWSVAASAGVAVHPYGIDGMGSLEFSLYTASGLRTYIGAVRSMRLPTFTDLYYTATGYISDASLVPEKALMARLGGEYVMGGWSFSALSYYRHGSDIIDWIRRDGEDVWRSSQLTSMDTFGTELSAMWHSGHGVLRDASLTYAHINSDKDSEGFISKYAIDYMRNKLSAGAGLVFSHGFALALTGTLYDRAGTEQKPYFLLDGRFSWTMGVVQIYVEGTNLTCTEYWDYTGLRMPSIWLDAGVVVTLR